MDASRRLERSLSLRGRDLHNGILLKLFERVMSIYLLMKISTKEMKGLLLYVLNTTYQLMDRLERPLSVGGASGAEVAALLGFEEDGRDEALESSRSDGAERRLTKGSFESKKSRAGCSRYLESRRKESGSESATESVSEEGGVSVREPSRWSKSARGGLEKQQEKYRAAIERMVEADGRSSELLRARIQEVLNVLNKGSVKEISKLKMIGKKRAEQILSKKGEVSFAGLEQLAWIGFREKSIVSFFKRNVVEFCGGCQE